MRTIWFFFNLCGYLIYAWPYMIKAKRLDKAGKRDERDALVLPLVRRWALRMLKVAKVTPQVSGLENLPGEPAVYVSNHQSDFDFLLMLACLDAPHPIVAKKEILKVPVVRTWMTLFDCVFIDRDNARQSVMALQRAAEMIQQGKSVIVFPEGTRSKGDRMGEFKAGAFMMAFRAKCPIVPVAIDGSYKAMEAQGVWMRPATVPVTILPKIDTAPLDRAAQRALPEDIARRIADAKSAN